MSQDKSGIVKDAELLGQPKPCTNCDGTTQAARLTTSTSTPKFDGYGWGRYCPVCKKQTRLDVVEMEQAKADYQAKHSAVAIA